MTALSVTMQQVSDWLKSDHLTQYWLLIGGCLTPVLSYKTVGNSVKTILAMMTIVEWIVMTVIMDD